MPDYNPFQDFQGRLARSRAQTCEHHPPLHKSKDPEEAALWVETVERCSEAARKDHLRWLGRNDLFFLLVHLLNRKHFIRDERTAAWTFARCDEVQESPDNHLDLWTRATFKSEIITFGSLIQSILNDPEITIGIFSHSRPMAKDFLGIIKREFEANDKLKALYDDILWKDPKLDTRRQSITWGENDGITVKRRGNPKEATVEAWGLVDGQPTGKRYKLLVYDDVVARDETSDVMIQKTTSEFMNSLLLTASDPPKFRYVATFQEIGDTTQNLIDNRTGVLRKRPTFDASGVSRCLSEETLSWFRQHLSAKVYALQILLDPTKSKDPHDIGFQREWIDFYNEVPPRKGMNVYILVDPAGNKPGSNSRFTAVVAGLCADKRIRWLDGIWDKLDLEECWAALLALVQKWEPLKVGYECYGMQRDIEHFKYRMKQINYEFHIEPLANTHQSKDDQIAALIPWFKQKRWLFPNSGLHKRLKDGQRVDLVQVFIEKEYLQWPYTKLKDHLDCMAHVEKPGLGLIWPRGYGVRGWKSGEDAATSSSGGGWMAG